MALSFPEISSAAEGKFDAAIDFAPALESSELINTVTAVSSHPALLEVTDVVKNAAEIQKDDMPGTIQIGKGVQLQLTTKQNTRRRRLWIDVRIVGTSNTQRDYQIQAPLVDYIRR